MKSNLGSARLRLAELLDNDILWLVRNDPDTRRQSADQDFIPYDIHYNWLAFALDSECYSLWVIEDEKGTPIGQLRFDINQDFTGEKIAEIALALKKGKRGMGYGSSALKTALEIAFNRLKLREVYAYIKPGNPASLKAFLKTGFKKEKSDNLQNLPTQKLTFKNPDYPGEKRKT